MFLVMSWTIVFLIVVCVTGNYIAGAKNHYHIAILLAIVYTLIYVLGVFLIVNYLY